MYISEVSTKNLVVLIIDNSRVESLRRSGHLETHFNLQHALTLFQVRVKLEVELTVHLSKAFALTWYRALTSYSSPARPFAAPDVPLLVTRQQGTPSLACRQLSRARNACAGGSSDDSTKLQHGTNLGRTLCY